MIWNVWMNAMVILKKFFIEIILPQIMLGYKNTFFMMKFQSALKFMYKSQTVSNL